MSARPSLRARTWTALALPPFTWFAFEQGLSALLHADCTRWPLGLAWGVASLALCALALRLAWPLGRRESALTNPWLARLATALAGVFGLAIAFQTLAVAIVPACVG
jgi:hypothetical protein